MALEYWKIQKGIASYEQANCKSSKQKDNDGTKQPKAFIEGEHTEYKYSTALSGLLKAARRARRTVSLSQLPPPISRIC